VTPDQIAAIQPRCTNTNGRADGYMMSSCAASAVTSGDMATKFLGVSRFLRTFFIRNALRASPAHAPTTPKATYAVWPRAYTGVLALY
jgi:hypothetical protein